MEAPTGISELNPQDAPARPAAERAAPSWAEALGTTGAIKLVILVALISWIYWDQYKRFLHFWQTPDWSHGFLIVPFCLYLVHMRRSELLLGRHEGSLWGLALLVASLGGYFFAIIAKIGYPQSLSIMGVIAGLVLLLRGWRSLWVTAFPIAFFFLAVPPPDRLYRQFTHPLQQMAAAISTWFLNLFPGVLEIEREGIKIGYWMEGGESGAFTVAGACSGMRSLMAFVALGLALAYITPRPTWQRVAMAVFVVPVALMCNILRVIITGCLQMYGHEDLAKGTPHTLLGLIMFAFGFVLYMGLLWVLDHLVVEEQDAAAES
ncbi:MAG: exosortase/archaeosortase family protein [Phycisphaerales bacterium]|nr:exosortase/archaeosortase family protein [Phycisphaerales bacterium]MCB9862196.1 exosortase/archaeosortase family protein [Phycisphaerales bacterium]